MICINKNYAHLFEERRIIEDKLAHDLPLGGKSFLNAYCSVCNTPAKLIYDHLYATENTVNWRERLVCRKCGLNNRLRLSITMLDQYISSKNLNKSRIYATEHLTPLGDILKRQYQGVVLSEYFGPDVAKGNYSDRGVQNQDVTSLTFKDKQFDILLSFDVLEHVPEYLAALIEFYRVLDHGGILILSAPFITSAAETVVRAKVHSDGHIEHVLAPEYHGDPINPDAGVLCFYYFGWSLLDELRETGFSDVHLSLNWSMDYGHIGPEQILIFATRS